MASYLVLSVLLLSAIFCVVSAIPTNLKDNRASPKAKTGSEESAIQVPVSTTTNDKKSSASDPAEPESGAEGVDTDDRINLNFNRGQAFAVGPGGFSGSNSNTFGINAGIKRPGYGYTPLFSQTGGHGSSFTSGPGAPHTWAGGNSRFGNGQIGGNAGAGFSGGRGNANANSYSQQIAIPMDGFGGTVLYMDLKDKKKPKPNANANAGEETSAKSDPETTAVKVN